MRELSFREKSIWGTLIGVTLVSAWYFWTVVEMLMADAVDLVTLGSLAVSLVVFLIIAEIVFHAVLAMRSPRDSEEPKDERDLLIELKGERVGSILLGVGVAFTIGHIALNEHFGTMATSPFITANLLLFFLTSSGIGKYVWQLAAYRRGA